MKFSVEYGQRLARFVSRCAPSHLRKDARQSAWIGIAKAENRVGLTEGRKAAEVSAYRIIRARGAVLNFLHKEADPVLLEPFNEWDFPRESRDLEIVEARASVEKLLKASGLTDRERAAIEMYMEDRTQSEMGRVLGLCQNACCVAVHSAIRKMRETAMTKAIVILIAAASIACGQVDLRTPPPAASNTVPYTGATADVNLGTRALTAAELRTSGGPSRIQLAQGTCPAAPSTGYDLVICLEAGVLYSVTSAGKQAVTPKQPVPQVEAFPISGLTINAQGVATITLTQQPKPGTLVHLKRFSSIAGEYIAKDLVASGRAIPVTLPQRPYTSADVIEVAYVFD